MKRLSSITILFFFLTLNIWSQPVPPTPGSDFAANDTIGCAPFVTNFISIIPNAVAWNWNFGNGVTSNASNPSIVYSNAGDYTVTLNVTLNNGTSFQISKVDYIKVSSNPVIDFVLNNSDQCVNSNNIHFQNNTMNVIQHLWDLGDGTMLTNSSVFHHYNSVGNYDITYFATNADGCISDTTVSNISIIPVVQNNPIVNGNSVSCDSSYAFSFSAQPSGLNSYSWEFSNGSTTSGAVVSNEFNSFNSFDLLLITEDQNGCVDSTLVPNIVETINYADDFTVSSNLACESENITFSTTAIGATSVFWDFGDGQTSNGSVVHHSYNIVGVYDVTMTTSRPSNCGQTIHKSNCVTVAQSSIANMIISDTVVCVNQSISFDLTSPNAQSFEWLFGDGNSSNLPSTSHHYNNPGIYSVQLIHNAGGCNDTLTKLVSVSQPLASFQNTTFSSCAPANMQFTNNSNNAISWQWSFSDGQTSQSQNPQIEFNLPGQYDAQLVVFDVNGCSDTSQVTNAVVISNNLPAGFQSASFNGCSPFSISLYDYSIGVGNWNWNFGDGSTSTLDTPEHTYYVPGEYIVSLSTVDAYGCAVFIDTMAIITVTSLMIDSINIELHCDSLSADFTVDCSDCVAGYWSFGNGSSSDSSVISNEYNDEGPFDVSYYGVNSIGCMGIYMFTINFDSCVVQNYTIPGQGPPSTSNWVDEDTVAFGQLPYHAYCGPITVQVDNPTPSAQDWIWHFGDGTIETGYEPSHTYSIPGMYTLMLESFDGLTYDTLYFHNFINVQGHTNSIITEIDTSCFEIDLSLNSVDTTLLNYFWRMNNNLITQGTTSFDTLLSSNNSLYSFILTTIDSNLCSYSTSLAVLANGTVPAFHIDSMACVGDSLIVNHNIPSNYQIIWSVGNVIVPDISLFMFTNEGLFDVTAQIIDLSGCNTLHNLGQVEVNSINGDFNLLSPSNMCVGDTIIISADSSNNDLYTWNLDNVLMISGGATLTGIVQSEGVFSIGLESALNGCYSFQHTDSSYIVNQADADFSFIQDNLCLPVEANFTDLSISPVSWNWDFADGTTSQLQNPDHVYTSQPNGQVSLTITDINGCIATASKNNIELFNASIGLSASSGCAPAPINFIDNSQNAISWNWNFGDGVSDTTQAPIHIYALEGIYDVSLIVVSADGCADTVFQPALVDIDRVEAIYGVSASTGCAPQPAYFIDNSYNAISWHWNFGNGVTSNQQNPIQIYYVGGNYSAELIVESASGCVDTAASSVVINGPLADFELLDTILCQGSVSQIINNSTNANNFTWLFGDGTSSNDVNPTHEYATSGLYVLTMIALDASGCQNVSTQSHQITVNETPNYTFSISDTIGCNPLSVSLIAQGVSNTYNWQINGASVGSGGNITTSLTTGNYDVTVLVESQNGCVDSSVIQNIEVHPVYSLTLNPIDATCENKDTIIVTSSSIIGDWFIEGMPNQNNIFNISSLTPGDYTISQRISGYCGTADSVNLHIDSLITSLIQLPQEFCEDDIPVTLFSSSTLGYWSGAGIIDPYSGQFDPSVANHGVNNAVYTILNGSCLFMDTTELTVKILPDASFIIENTAHCEGNDFNIGLTNPLSTAVYTWTFSNQNDTISVVNLSPMVSLTSGIWSVYVEASDNGCLNASSENDIRVFDTLAPHTPEIIRSTILDNKSVLTEWKDPLYGSDKISSFEIWKSVDSVNFNLAGEVSRNERQFIDNNAKISEQNYYYMLRPINVCRVDPEKVNMSSSILLKKEMLNDQQVRFIWTQYYNWDEGVDYYKLQKLNEFGEWEDVETLEGESNSAIIGQP